MQVASRRFDRRWSWVARRAAVAVVLRRGSDGHEVLLMERQRRAGDPWSGHVSFPGGFGHAGEDDRAIAIRETAEELGLDLSAAPVAGRLGAVLAFTSERGLFAIAPIVFTWDGPATLTLSHEATAAFWLPLSALTDPSHATRRRWRVLGVPLRLPAWSWDGHVIWGLTRRMLLDLAGRL